MKHTLTLSSVKYAALLILESQSSVTTLEIKNLLRSLQFNATQNEVSELLKQAADELPLQFTTLAGYREYSLPSLQSVVQQAAPVSISYQSPSEVQYGVTRRDGKVVTAVPTKPSRGSYYTVTNAWDEDIQTLYFDADMYNRDEVRSAYARITSTAFADSRAKLTNVCEE